MADKICKFFNINPIIPDYNKSIFIIKNTSWLSGFFDIKGHFTIINNYTLTFNIEGQKNRYILDLIYDSFKLGHIRFNENYYKFTISNIDEIKYILNFFKLYPLKTIKNIDIRTYNRIIYMLDNKYHYQNHPLNYRINNLITLFKNRNKS